MDPWGGRKHVGVLILGGDSGPGRYGTRTDTVTLLDVDTRTGEVGPVQPAAQHDERAVPGRQPAARRLPGRVPRRRRPGGWMLNAVYGQVPALHPGILGNSDNEGADAAQAGRGRAASGTRVDYYVMVDLQGFPKIVDAMGGVTVNVNEPVAIGGNTDRGIPPDGYLEPGPDQHLDGFHALWFARGRYGSDDYQRMLRQRCMIDALIDEARPAEPAAPLPGPRRRRQGDPPHRHPAGAAAGVRRPRRQGQGARDQVGGVRLLGQVLLRRPGLRLDAAGGRPGARPARAGDGEYAGHLAQDEEHDDEAPPDDASDVTDPEDPGASVTVSDTCGYAPTS